MPRSLPGGWRQISFGEIARDVSARNRDRHEMPVLSVTKYDGFVPSEQYFKKKVFSADTENYKIVRRGQFAYATIHLDEGSVDRLTKFDAGLISPMYTVFQLDEDETDPEFVLRLFKLFSSNGRFDALGNGGVNRRKSISFSTLSKLTLALPPLPEQRRIAEILSSVDEAIAATRAVIEQTKKVKQGVLERLLTSGIGYTRFKQTEIGEIPEGWRAGIARDFFTLQRGFDLTEKQATPGMYPVISSSGESYTHAKAMVEGPVVITGRKGRLGLVHYVDGPCWPHDTTLWVKDFKGNHPRYVYWYLRGLKLERLDAATAVPTLNRNVVHAERAAFPPPSEQIQIAAHLDSFEDAAYCVEITLSKLMATKSALMSDLLTGRRRVHETLPLAAE